MTSRGQLAIAGILTLVAAAAPSGASARQTAAEPSSASSDPARRALASLRQAVDTGIQPSELLRYFDSGNTWKMQKLCAAVGARYTNDPAANVKAVLDYCSRKAAARKGVDKR